MRDALRESLAAVTHPVDRYPAGSIIVCTSCLRPLFRLESGIGVGDRVGQAADRFRPVRFTDLLTLADREDVDAGLRAWIKGRTLTELSTYCHLIPSPRTGDPAICPQCGHVWVLSRTGEVSDTRDRAYVFELFFIPPNTKAAPMRRRGSPFLR